jgi:hypothetical protein
MVCGRRTSESTAAHNSSTNNPEEAIMALTTTSSCDPSDRAGAELNLTAAVAGAIARTAGAIAAETGAIVATAGATAGGAGTTADAADVATACARGGFFTGLIATQACQRVLRRKYCDFGTKIRRAGSRI